MAELTINKSLIRATLDALDALIATLPNGEESVSMYMNEEALKAAEQIEAPSPALVRQLTAEIRYRRASHAQMTAQYNAVGAALKAYADEFGIGDAGGDLVQTVIEDARASRYLLDTLLTMKDIHPPMWVEGALDALTNRTFDDRAESAYKNGFDMIWGSSKAMNNQTPEQIIATLIDACNGVTTPYFEGFRAGLFEGAQPPGQVTVLSFSYSFKRNRKTFLKWKRGYVEGKAIARRYSE